MKLKQIILICFGFAFLLVGIIGVFLPVLPTTPFIILASFCFTSSKRLSEWLMKSRFFGEYITNYKERKGLSKTTVIKSLVFLWIMLTISILSIASLWSAILLPFIGAAVTVHILMIAKPKEMQEQVENRPIE